MESVFNAACFLFLKGLNAHSDDMQLAELRMLLICVAFLEK